MRRHICLFLYEYDCVRVACVIMYECRYNLGERLQKTSVYSDGHMFRYTSKEKGDESK